jgi:hypothetical protein
MPTPFDTSDDPVRVFVGALPGFAQAAFSPDHRTIPAIRACAERGDDVAAWAARCARGLERRRACDVRSLLIFRVLRDSGRLNDEESV